MEATQDSDAEVRKKAIRARGKHREASAIPRLSEAARDEAHWVRATAVEALGRL
jgi:HEAT repeat protein